MKKIASLFLCVGISGLISAQQTNFSPKSSHKNLEGTPANVITKSNSTEADEQYFIDYEGFDENFFSQIQTYVKVGFNSNDTTSGTINQAMVLIDTLLVTTDYQSFESIEWFQKNIRIDTLYIVVGQQNNSGDMATFKISLHNYKIDSTSQTAASGHFIRTTSTIWSDSLVIDTSLTTPPSGEGYAIKTLKFASGANTDSAFAVVFEYFGNPTDTAYLRYSYPTDGSNCAGGYPTILTSELYPQSFYSVSLGDDGNGAPIQSIYIPRISGNMGYYWYNDCDGSGDPYNITGDNTSGFSSSENSYQQWSIWALVTISDFIGVQEQEEKGVNVFAYPNPPKSETTISFQLKQDANVSISINDICGKTIYKEQLGNKPKGKNSYTFDVSELTNGLYTYTVSKDNQQVTRKFTVQH